MKRIMSFILIAAMLMTVQGIPVRSETINAGNLTRASSGQPANPVHHCSGDGNNLQKDTTDWSYVNFGSYPQTEVVGKTLTADIVDANYNASGDAWINGAKYRRITIKDVNSTMKSSNPFGGREYRYFKYEPIKWRVLSNDGKKLFLMSDKGIDCKNYNEESAYVTWEESPLRLWLNKIFYATAFSGAEQSAIVKKTVVTEGENDTEDKIFLLSPKETLEPSYGYCSINWMGSNHRRIEPTEYARAKGVEYYPNSKSDSGIACKWFLRSKYVMNEETTLVCAVTSKGYTCEPTSSDAQFLNAFDYCNRSDCAVVPALQINLSSSSWSIADDEIPPKPEAEDPINPIHHCYNYQTDLTDETDWSYVYFGSYPQTEITGDRLTPAIIGATYNSTGDAWIEGAKYRRVKRNGTYKYFKWERIKWRVLNKSSLTSTLFLMADNVLDQRAYSRDVDSQTVTWENSYLRKWLNYKFYTAAFSSGEQKDIVEQKVRNQENPKLDMKGGNDTNDKIYLLSPEEASDPYYGFCRIYQNGGATRFVQPSGYSYYNEWWMRSPGDSNYGKVSTSSSNGIVPVLHVQMDSEFLYTEDDGTSGEGGSNIEEEIEISLNKTEESLKPGKTLQLTAEINDAEFSKNGIVWSSSDPNVASVSHKGLVTAKNIGTATITAELEEEDLNVSASCQITVEEVKVSKIIMAENLTLTEGKTFKLTAIVLPTEVSNKRLAWSNSDTTVATVDSTGLVTAIKAGKTTVTATSTDGSNISASCEVTVEKKPEEAVKVSGITLDRSSSTLSEGDTLKLAATVTPANAANQSLTWSSSDANTATVDDAGLVTALKAGTVIITATSTDGSNVRASCEVTVEKKPEEAVKVSGITMNKSSSTLTEGDTLKLTATVVPTNATNQSLTWNSSDTMVATVNAAGLVTALKAGKTTITATSTDGSNISASCEVTVEKKPEEAVKVSGITLDKSSSTLTEGDTLKLAATVAPANATNQRLTWSSSGTTTATVDATGLVTAVKEGTATITATSTDGSNISASCVITVEKQKQPAEEIKIKTITLSQTAVVLQEGQTSKLTATVSPDNAKNKDLEWISSDTAVADIDTTGMITAKKAGTAVIIVLAKDGSGARASCGLTVEKKTEETPKPPENSTIFSYRKAIAKADVSFAEDSLYYTGAPVIPQITVSYDGQELIPDTDYTVTYENNINIGNAKATIEGIGAYSGKKFATFPIKGKIGAIFEYKKGKYKILNASEVSYQGITSAKTKKVQIPQVVALGNKYFKVTKIADNALKNTKVTSVVIGNQVNSIGKSAMSGCKSLSQVVIGKNVSKVGKKAFYNCKKLKKITIHSSKLKAKNIGSNAYKGIYGKARIEVPSGKVKEYKKWLKSKGAGSKIKVVEK